MVLSVVYLWFFYGLFDGFLSDSARFSMVFVSFVQGDATRNHWVIFGGQNLALRNKGFLHLTGEICIIIIYIYITYIYIHIIYIYIYIYNLYTHIDTIRNCCLRSRFWYLDMIDDIDYTVLTGRPSALHGVHLHGSRALDLPFRGGGSVIFWTPKMTAIWSEVPV